mgnify:CR=1 FL=1
MKKLLKKLLKTQEPIRWSVGGKEHSYCGFVKAVNGNMVVFRHVGWIDRDFLGNVACPIDKIDWLACDIAEDLRRHYDKCAKNSP